MLAPSRLLLHGRGSRDVFLGDGSGCSCLGAGCAAGGATESGLVPGGCCCDLWHCCFPLLRHNSPQLPCANGAVPTHRAAAAAKPSVALLCQSHRRALPCSPVGPFPTGHSLGSWLPDLLPQHHAQGCHSTKDPTISSGTFVTRTGDTQPPPTSHLFPSPHEH